MKLVSYERRVFLVTAELQGYHPSVNRNVLDLWPLHYVFWSDNNCQHFPNLVCLFRYFISACYNCMNWHLNFSTFSKKDLLLFGLVIRSAAGWNKHTYKRDQSNIFTTLSLRMTRIIFFMLKLLGFEKIHLNICLQRF